jgi:type IV secretion system protein VirB11
MKPVSIEMGPIGAQTAAQNTSASGQVVELPSDANRDQAVKASLRCLRPFIDAEGVIEVCVNRPGEVWVETTSGWVVRDAPDVTFKALLSLATAIATFTQQMTGERRPLLSATLPSGERIQLLQPPATKPGIVAVAIRRPDSRVRSLAELEGEGLFRDTNTSSAEAEQIERDLAELHAQRRFGAFLGLAVKARKTILLAGATGSGKTSFMKALCEEIPRDQRLITLEDSAEVGLPNHRNKLHLFYSKGGQGVAAGMTPTQLMQACMRLRPDRILLAEVRGEEAWTFLDGAASGHPGSMTTIHAGSCDEAMERLSLLVRQSAAGGGMTTPEIRQLADSVIDVVVHFARIGPRFTVTGLQYRPPRKKVSHG